MYHHKPAGPPEGDPPGWINWGSVANEAPEADPHESDPHESDSSEVSSDEKEDDGLPFNVLPKNKDGKTCRCGSDTHLTVQSHACPMNPRNRPFVGSVDDDGTDDSDSNPVLTLTLNPKTLNTKPKTNPNPNPNRRMTTRPPMTTATPMQTVSIKDSY